MGSTARTTTQPADFEHATALHWRSWPLAERWPWSWLVPLGIVSVGAAIWALGGGLLFAAAAVVGLAGTLWQFWIPIRYEIDSLGLRRFALGRSRLFPWHVIRAYQLRSSGVVLYRRADPINVDVFRSLFVPYPADEDEMLCALREHLPHAVELPQ